MNQIQQTAVSSNMNERSIRRQVCRAAILLSVVLSLGVSAQATIVSVNQYVFANSGELVGPTSAAESGQFTGATGYNEDYWNDLNTGTHNGTLLDSDGNTVSGLSVTLGGSGGNANWSVGSLSGNDKNMMMGFLSGGASASGIPYATYDLVVYDLPDSLQFADQSSSVTLTIGATSTTVNQSLTGLPTGFTTFDVAGNPGGTISAGNFNTIIFKGLTSSSFSLSDVGNGFQIAEVLIPEPSTALLLALGGLLLARARRGRAGQP